MTQVRLTQDEYQRALVAVGLTNARADTGQWLTDDERQLAQVLLASGTVDDGYLPIVTMRIEPESQRIAPYFGTARVDSEGAEVLSWSFDPANGDPVLTDDPPWACTYPTPGTYFPTVTAVGAYGQAIDTTEIEVTA